MRWKFPVILSLTLLQGAAGPQQGCVQDITPGQVPLGSLSVDLATRGGSMSGMTGETTQSMPQISTNSGCSVSSSPASVSSALRNEHADIVHGLPLPDILRSPLEPRTQPGLDQTRF